MTLLLITHIVVSLFLIFIVLIQSSKGADMGAAFGGSSQTLFGSRGAATFFSKLTTVSAIVFMLTSLSLAVLSSKTDSVVQKAVPAKEGTTIPATQGPVKGGVQPANQSPEQPSQPAKK